MPVAGRRPRALAQRLSGRRAAPSRHVADDSGRGRRVRGLAGAAVPGGLLGRRRRQGPLADRPGAGLRRDGAALVRRPMPLDRRGERPPDPGARRPGALDRRRLPHRQGALGEPQSAPLDDDAHLDHAHGSSPAGGCTSIAARAAWRAWTADDGAILWETTDWQIGMATCPSPVIVGDGRVFFCGGYNAGSLMLQVERQRRHAGRPRRSSASRRSSSAPSSRRRSSGTAASTACGRRTERLVCLDLAGEGIVEQRARQVRLGAVPDRRWADLCDERRRACCYGRATAGRLRAAGAGPGHPDGATSWGPMALAAGRLIVRDFTRMVVPRRGGGAGHMKQRRGKFMLGVSPWLPWLPRRQSPSARSPLLADRTFAATRNQSPARAVDIVPAVDPALIAYRQTAAWPVGMRRPARWPWGRTRDLHRRRPGDSRVRARRDRRGGSCPGRAAAVPGGGRLRRRLARPHLRRHGRSRRSARRPRKAAGVVEAAGRGGVAQRDRRGRAGRLRRRRRQQHRLALRSPPGSSRGGSAGRDKAQTIPDSSSPATIFPSPSGPTACCTWSIPAGCGSRPSPSTATWNWPGARARRGSRVFMAAAIRRTWPRWPTDVSSPWKRASGG